MIFIILRLSKQVRPSRTLVTAMRQEGPFMNYATARAVVRRALKLRRSPAWTNLSPILCEELSAFATEGAAAGCTDAWPSNGYPRQPFAYRIADTLVEWATTGVCLVPDMSLEGVQQLTSVNRDLLPWKLVSDAMRLVV